MLTLEELDKVVADAFGNADFSGTPEELYAPIGYMVSLGGKRLRPKLCLLVYSLFKDDLDESVIMPAVGLETFHGFTLIHDDMMDKSDLRRGSLTVHRKWNDNVAILSGDVMSIMAYRFIQKAPVSRLQEVMELFSCTAAQVCEGQQYDMNFETADHVSMDDYMRMIGLKTAVLIACSAKMGAVIAGAQPSVCDSIYEYAYRIGLAFQIADDYLDSFGNVDDFGKPIGKDILCNKKNWMLITAMNMADSETKTEIMRLLALSSEENAKEKIDGITGIYRRLGIDRLALEAVEQYHKSAYASLSGSGLDVRQIELLSSFGDMLVKRKK